MKQGSIKLKQGLIKITRIDKNETKFKYKHNFDKNETGIDKIETRIDKNDTKFEYKHNFDTNLIFT
jgi:hypothetical protein